MAARARRAGAWSALMALSVASAALLRWVGAPAALMLGPLLSAIVLAQANGKLALPRWLLVAAQALLGCRLAMEITPAVLRSGAAFLPMAAALAVLVLLATTGFAVVATRRAWIPAGAALFGLSPGAAAPMVMLSEAYGADPRIVATMQYLRVVAAALVAIAVGAALGDHRATPQAAAPENAISLWFGVPDRVAFAETLALALLGALAAWASRQPAAVFFVPTIGGGLLQVAGLGRVAMPNLLLAAAFAVIGWNIGLKFTRASLAVSVRLMPRILALIGAMIGLCALASLVLVLAFGADPLSAYLALSPGGVDSVVIVATTSHVDMALVLASQVTRLVVVLLAAPALARWVARRLDRG
jgi:uncharacterized protein